VGKALPLHVAADHAVEVGSVELGQVGVAQYHLSAENALELVLLTAMKPGIHRALEPGREQDEGKAFELLEGSSNTEPQTDGAHLLRKLPPSTVAQKFTKVSQAMGAVATEHFVASLTVKSDGDMAGSFAHDLPLRVHRRPLHRLVVVGHDAGKIPLEALVGWPHQVGDGSDGIDDHGGVTRLVDLLPREDCGKGMEARAAGLVAEQLRGDSDHG
jgi:hypothetical protein